MNNRFIRRTTAALRSWQRTSEPTLFSQCEQILEYGVLWKIPGHALHEKGLQRQKGIDPLVSSQERRARFVLRINRGSDAGQTRILFFHRFT